MTFQTARISLSNVEIVFLFLKDRIRIHAIFRDGRMSGHGILGVSSEVSSDLVKM
jgi:hypothetical protein